MQRSYNVYYIPYSHKTTHVYRCLYLTLYLHIFCVFIGFLFHLVKEEPRDISCPLAVLGRRRRMWSVHFLSFFIFFTFFAFFTTSWLHSLPSFQPPLRYSRRYRAIKYLKKTQWVSTSCLPYYSTHIVPKTCSGSRHRYRGICQMQGLLLMLNLISRLEVI